MFETVESTFFLYFYFSHIFSLKYYIYKSRRICYFATSSQVLSRFMTKSINCQCFALCIHNCKSVTISKNILKISLNFVIEYIVSCSVHGASNNFFSFPPYTKCGKHLIHVHNLPKQTLVNLAGGSTRTSSLTLLHTDGGGGGDPGEPNRQLAAAQQRSGA
jgi:hypothetical protein